VIVEVFATFDGSLSTRQCFYQCVSRGAVPNSESGYDKVQRALVALRRDGTVPFERVVDRTRSRHVRSSWNGMREILDQAASQYRRDAWRDQEFVVMVACEKQALEGIFSEVVDEFGASLWTLRGYPSDGLLFEWATDIRLYVDEGKSVVIRYAGDFDPSGIDIERKAAERLRELGAEFEWERIGLFESDFEVFDLVELPAKRTDSRSASFIARYGERCAELDALPPDELRRRIRDAIEPFIDQERWERIRQTEELERESLANIARNWGATGTGT
jgi:hypothetical protein